MTSDSDEFFDAMSEIVRSPSDDFHSDSDNDDSDVYVPVAEDEFDEFVEPTIKKSDSERKLAFCPTLESQNSMKRSSSDNVLGSRKELQVDNLQKVKSASASNYVSGAAGEKNKGRRLVFFVCFLSFECEKQSQRVNLAYWPSFSFFVNCRNVSTNSITQHL